MKDRLRNASLAVIGTVGLLLIGGAVGRGCAAGGTTDAELVKQLSELRERHVGVVSVMNDEIDSLRELIDSKDEDLGLQADLILELSDQPTEVRYIVKTVTVVEPINVPQTVAVKDLPAEKLFGFRALEGGDIVTDRMTSKDTNGDGVPDEVTFTPYGQKFILDGAIGDESSSFILRVQSDYDSVIRSLPLDLKVTRVGGTPNTPKRKVVDPELALQVGGFAGAGIFTRAPVAGYAAGVSMPWLHPTTSLDLLSPSVTLGTSWYPDDDSSALIIRGGATIISSNVGGHGRGILKDTWVGADIGIGTDLGLSGGLVLATRL
jgi:hypothetical protein